MALLYVVYCVLEVIEMEKRDIYEIAEDVLWTRLVWQLVAIGGSIVGVGLGVLTVMFL